MIVHFEKSTENTMPTILKFKSTETSDQLEQLNWNTSEQTENPRKRP